MSEARREDFVQRVSAVLVGLEMIASEARAANFDSKVAASVSDAVPSQNDQTERLFEQLEGWIRRAEREINAATHSQAGELTANQRTYWVLLDEGRRDAEVATRHGLALKTVHAIRRVHGKEIRFGRSRAKLGRPKKAA